MRSICILDGDRSAQHNLNNYTIVLPGKKSPEEMVFNYAKELYDNDDSFWVNKTICDLGYVKINFRDRILPDIIGINSKIEQLKLEDKSIKGVRREENKRVFNIHRRFFELIMKKWIEDHAIEVNQFYKNLYILFCKVSEFHDINSKEWEW